MTQPASQSASSAVIAPPPALDAAQQLYVYAVMRAEDAPLLDSAAVSAPGETLRSISCGALQAIVSPIDTDEVMATRRNLTTHARALEALMDWGPILPMRFGLVTTEADAVRATLAPHEELLLAELSNLQECVEMGVRISWDRATAMREIVAEDPNLRRAYERIAGRPETEVHYEKVELGRRVAAALEAKQAAEGAALAARLGEHARDMVIHEGDDEMSVLKADFLIERLQEPALAAEIEALESEAPDRLTIKYVGPAPAYNFVKLRLAWAGAAAEPLAS